MLVKVTVTLRVKDPELWTRTSIQGGRPRRVPDRRPLAEKVQSIADDVAWGANEYAGQVEDEPLAEIIPEPTTKENKS